MSNRPGKLFDQLMQVEEYRKLFDKFSDDQKPLLIERVRSFLEEAESKLINPLTDLAEKVKKEQALENSKNKTDSTVTKK
jgi:hypothetical protein